MFVRYRRKVIDLANGLPLMEPMEYCRRWVQHIQPGERGYRAECIRALEKATFGTYKFDTINRNWGPSFDKRPEVVLELLRVADLLNTLDIGLATINTSVEELLEKVKQIAPHRRDE